MSDKVTSADLRELIEIIQGQRDELLLQINAAQYKAFEELRAFDKMISDFQEAEKRLVAGEEADAAVNEVLRSRYGGTMPVAEPITEEFSNLIASTESKELS